ncbi:hypothetical protein HUW62_03905 [Myxococcus sp. AM011]|uniref:hypothetical protein n=1 Tax=Myxococcus sp. AM011 TaxID=2745200 RepID=UPI0015959188|nr:hypothetical protein [Myxococcus sp. AM011]NVJ20365.1 hypothetical protein [Myxococcus sp. AM011]
MKSELLQAFSQSSTFATFDDRSLPDDITVIFASTGLDDRGVLPAWEQRRQRLPEQCVSLSKDPTNPTMAHASISSRSQTISLHEPQQLWSFANHPTSVCIDITSLTPDVWAPLIESALTYVPQLIATYVEPKDYRLHPNPTEATMFDLSSSFHGIAPLPGFAKLLGPEDEFDTVFVAFLGFEGSRARVLANSLDPLPPTTAVIGIPGMRPEYPALAVSSNRDFLDECRPHLSVRFAAASCPFEAEQVLTEISLEYPTSYMYVAPIGTTPHSLGAVLFAAKHKRRVELMYDHPIHSPSRTSGIGPTHVFVLK